MQTTESLTTELTSEPSTTEAQITTEPLTTTEQLDPSEPPTSTEPPTEQRTNQTAIYCSNKHGSSIHNGSNNTKYVCNTYIHTPPATETFTMPERITSNNPTIATTMKKPIAKYYQVTSHWVVILTTSLPEIKQQQNQYQTKRTIHQWC